jgi:hypothetical protein
MRRDACAVGDHLRKLLTIKICRPLPRARPILLTLDPRAYAPGFMPSRAPRALSRSVVVRWANYMITVGTVGFIRARRFEIEESRDVRLYSLRLLRFQLLDN